MDSPRHILGIASRASPQWKRQIDIDLRIVIASSMALLAGVVTARRTGSVLVLLVGHTA